MRWRLLAATLALACSGSDQQTNGADGGPDLAATPDLAARLDVPATLDTPLALDVPTTVDVPVTLDGPATLDAPATLDLPPALDGRSVVDAAHDVPMTADSLSALDGGGEAGPSIRLFYVTPTVIDLGTIPVGAVFSAKISVSSLTSITDLTVAATGAGLSIDNAATTCTGALGILTSTSCTVTVDFLADSVGDKRNQVVITAGGATGTLVSVPILATVRNAAELAIAPGTAMFAVTAGQSSSPIGFVVTNTGDVTTGQLSVGLTGTDAKDFAATTDCLILAPQATCTISVVFRPPPTRITSSIATLTVTNTEVGAACVSASLSGTAFGLPSPSITSATSDLGTVMVGTTGTAVSFTVRNLADFATGPLMVNVGSPDFVIVDDQCSDVSLAEYETCTISIALKPMSTGAKTSTLVVSGPECDPAVKTITGVGITDGHTIQPRPSSLDFGIVPIGATSAAQTVTLSNVGGAPTGAITISQAGDFDLFPVSENTCTGPVSPGASCSFKVSFAPQAARAYSATVTITDGTGSGTVTLSGTGTS